MNNNNSNFHNKINTKKEIKFNHNSTINSNKTICLINKSVNNNNFTNNLFSRFHNIKLLK